MFCPCYNGYPQVSLYSQHKCCTETETEVTHKNYGHNYILTNYNDFIVHNARSYVICKIIEDHIINIICKKICKNQLTTPNVNPFEHRQKDQTFFAKKNKSTIRHVNKTLQHNIMFKRKFKFQSLNFTLSHHLLQEIS